MMKTEELNLVTEWDKVFPKSEKVDHKKVTFANHFGITLAADMYIPKNATGKLPAFKNSMRFRNTCIEDLRGLKKSACWQKFTRASLTISDIDVSCSATPR